MNIQKINLFTPKFVLNTPKNNRNQDVRVDNYSYNPISYLDYNVNVNFTARLNRTPENFYQQSFNVNNMPDTMKAYLFEDYEDRKNMPPAQMLSLVFDDLNEVKSLEQVKRIFPEEKLFKSLKDVDEKKARTGILAEIAIMRSDGVPLFKNGEDNLGLYILKKIYLEGKTLNEINKDLSKDVSSYYKDLSPIKYETISAYGIKFPKSPFWKSFIATREDFPYVYKPRKPFMRETHVERTVQPKQERSVKVDRQPLFKNVSNNDVDKLSRAVVKGRGNRRDTKKLLKRSNVQNNDSLNFVAKYMSEINSVVLEKLHVSDEMKEFFENYDSLSKSQKQKFDAYWNRPNVAELRSKVMSSTIRFFFDVYGADGNNDEFQELLEYARNIKPNRLKLQEEHNRIQAEYDEMGRLLDEKDLKEKEIEHNSVVSVEKTSEEVSNDLNMSSTLEKRIRKYVDGFTNILPSKLRNKYAKLAYDQQIIKECFQLSSALDSIELSDNKIEDQLFKKMTNLIDLIFERQYAQETFSAHQAMLDVFIKNVHNRAQDVPLLFKSDLFSLANYIRSLPEERKAIFMKRYNTDLDKAYEKYIKPLSNDEVTKICITINDLLSHYSMEDSVNFKHSEYGELSPLFYSLSLQSKDKEGRKQLRKFFGKYVSSFGASARFLLDKNVDEKLKMAKLEQLLYVSFELSPQSFAFMALFHNKDGSDFLQRNYPRLYEKLKASGM